MGHQIGQHLLAMAGRTAETGSGPWWVGPLVVAAAAGFVWGIAWPQRRRERTIRGEVAAAHRRRQARQAMARAAQRAVRR